MQKFTPCLWFDGRIQEAADFYISVFKDGKIIGAESYPEGAQAAAGTPLTVTVELHGQRFLLLNGGPQFKFTEAVSFQIDCADQAEVDRYWSALAGDGGEESMCGWLKDKFGLSWQVVPRQLARLLSDPDKGRAQRVTHAMLQMRKIDIAALERAAAG